MAVRLCAACIDVMAVGRVVASYRSGDNKVHMTDPLEDSASVEWLVRGESECEFLRFHELEDLEGGTPFRVIELLAVTTIRGTELCLDHAIARRESG